MTDTPALVFAKRLQTAFGGPLLRTRREFRVLCPVHESDGVQHRPSLAVWQRHDQSLTFCCMTGCKHSAVRQKIAEKGISMPFSRGVDRDRDDEVSDGIQRARSIVEASTAVQEGDAVDRYLRSRAIVPRASEMRCLRITRGTRDGSWLFVQTLIDPLSLDTERWEATGVQITFLDNNGVALRRAMGNGRQQTMRKVFGKKKGNGVVIGAPHRHMIVGEGVESTWSAMRLQKASFGIAALGAMTYLNLPLIVRDITIAADNDRAGIARADLLANEWVASGYHVRIVTWGDYGVDANDALKSTINIG